MKWGYVSNEDQSRRDILGRFLMQVVNCRIKRVFFTSLLFSYLQQINLIKTSLLYSSHNSLALVTDYALHIIHEILDQLKKDLELFKIHNMFVMIISSPSINENVVSPFT